MDEISGAKACFACFRTSDFELDANQLVLGVLLVWAQNRRRIPHKFYLHTSKRTSVRSEEPQSKQAHPLHAQPWSPRSKVAAGNDDPTVGPTTHQISSTFVKPLFGQRCPSQSRCKRCTRSYGHLDQRSQLRMMTLLMAQPRTKFHLPSSNRFLVRGAPAKTNARAARAAVVTEVRGHSWKGRPNW